MHTEEIQDKGKVTACVDGKAIIELQRGGGCKSCSMRGFCFSKSTPAVFHLETDLPLEAGDEVELDISPEARVLASLLIFGLPVLSLIVSFIIANHFISELGSIIIAFGAMALSFFIIRLCDKNWGNKVRVRIVRKL